MGLDDFKSEEPRTTSKSKDRKSAKDSSFHDIVELRAGQRMTKGLLEKIRQEYIADYYPDQELESGWSYKEVALISCVCGERVIVETHTVCDECGREYARTGRAVVMVKRGN